MTNNRSKFDVKVLRQQLQRSKENLRRRQEVKTENEDVPKETKEEQPNDEDAAKKKNRKNVPLNKNTKMTRP